MQDAKKKKKKWIQKRVATREEIEELVNHLRLKLNDFDLGYIAGIIDGEGTITIIPRKRNRSCKFDGFSVSVRVANNDPRIIKKLNDLLIDIDGNVGNIQEKRKNRCGTSYYWAVAARRALIFLKVIEPYLISKKEQAKIAIELQERITTFTGINIKNRDNNGKITKGSALSDKEIEYRKTLYHKIKELNKRGPEKDKYYNQFKLEILNEKEKKQEALDK